MNDYSLPPFSEDRFPVHITKHYLCQKIGNVDIWTFQKGSKRGLNSKVNRGLQILRLQYIPCFCTFSETALKIELSGVPVPLPRLPQGFSWISDSKVVSTSLTNRAIIRGILFLVKTISIQPHPYRYMYPHCLGGPYRQTLGRHVSPRAMTAVRTS